MDLSTKLEIINQSDTGRKRPHNEDSTITDARNGLVILADGMGGYKAGEVASALAVTDILQGITEGLKKIKKGRVVGYESKTLAHFYFGHHPFFGTDWPRRTLFHSS